MRDEERRAGPETAAYPGGFDAFFRAEYRRMVKALMVMEGASPADADDCVAHAMEKLLERWHLPAADPGWVRHPRAYALETARRKFRTERRRRQSVVEDDASNLPADEGALTVVEARQVVADVLEGLPSAQRQVMHLITEGYTPAEIAEILGKKPHTVRQLAHLVKKRLRPVLETPAPRREEEQR
ncbi:RNA polymerase sigma factor [Amycolatopsis sp. CA-128772]|uniref:RNA polymerase sigma factor n=1 Tax=Amycolatopsis sp. CA-128772 TaxID=2073159 RepID=UPI000CD0B50A|nr:sigma-70 family RNA polymerase sigma factor [Amycolatopsis sp. CA-128772]